MSDSLDLHNMTVFRTGRKQVLKDINFSLNAGEVVALLGANGTGKSTLVSTLSRDYEDLQLDPDSTAYINGISINDLSLRELARQRAVLSQHHELSFDLKVSDVIEMGTYSFTELSPSQAKLVVEEAMEWADVSDFSERTYLRLSGGERQRVQLARAIAQLLANYDSSESKRYFILDEPTSSLDPKYQHLVLKRLTELAQEKQIGVLVILHDVNLAAYYCHRLLMLSEGQLIAYGTPQEVLTEANLFTVYGIEAKAIEHPFQRDKLLVVWT